MPRTFRTPPGQDTKIPIETLLNTSNDSSTDIAYSRVIIDVVSNINDEDTDDEDDDEEDPYDGEEPTTALFSMGPLIRQPGATPDVVAVPLPTVDGGGKEEKWYKYKMSWSGKVYDIEVGANDLWVFS